MDSDIDGELGLKVLYEGSNPTVDIVAVHGLGANPRYAWVAKVDDPKELVSDKSAKERSVVVKIPIVNFLVGVLYFLISLFFASKESKPQEDKINGVNWLADLLPGKTPHACIMTFNYVSRWHKKAPKQDRRACGVLFLESLIARRKEANIVKRPLIFIGHSFGGNVIEQMLVIAKGREDASFIAKDTVGVIFLGTPHRGSASAKWGRLIAFSGRQLGLTTEDRILNDLQEESGALKGVLEEFTLWLFRLSVPTVCFYEQYETDYGAKIGGFCKWKEMVVDEKSACLDGHEKLPLPKDHLKLNKYSGEQDSSFRYVYPYIQRMAESSQEIIHRRYHPQPVIRSDSDSGVTDSNHKKCLYKLHETNPPDDLAAIRRAKVRAKGTCEWLLLQEEYTTWVVSDRSQLLRLEGSPGIGKTVLASFLVEELEKRAQTTPHMTFAYYFCDNKDEKRRTAISILRGLILQLLRQHKLFQHIQPDFDVQGEQLFKSFEALWRILLSLLRDPKSGDVFLLIDALDECEKSSREDLLDALEKLLTSSEPLKQTGCSGKLKILITCRREPDIRRKLGKISTPLPVDTGKVNADLREFINIKITEISNQNEWMPNLKESVLDALINKARGTFLWASLVLKELEKTDRDQIRDKLNELPPDLNDLYDRILLGIERVDAAQFVLQFIAAARRPLTQRELGMAYVLKRGRGEDILALEDQLDESKDIYAVCKQIVYLDEHDGTVHLIHQSAKDYLLGDHLKESEKLKQYYVVSEKANLLIFQICWTYLSMEEFDQGNKIISRRVDNVLQSKYLPYKYLRGHCFLQYACAEWQEHVLAASSALVTDYEFNKDNLGKMPTLRDNWLLRAAAKGQEGVVRLLLKKGADMESKSTQGRTPLWWAAWKGHEAVVKLLLEKGADMECKDTNGQTPLWWAVWAGHEAVVKLLLEKGADMESKDTKYGQTPLSWSAEKGHEAVVKLLLEKGADMESKDTNGRTPLSLAAVAGHEAVVKLLLEKEADMESKDTNSRTPLWWAARAGHGAVVKLLLEKGAEKLLH